MRKKASVISLLIALFSTGCAQSIDIQSDNINKQPSMMKEINFDGTYVQTYPNTSWRIAFYSYNVENETLTINGDFIVPSNAGFDDIKSLEMSFNDRKDVRAYVISYNPIPHDLSNYTYSNPDNAIWELIDINNENHCSFSLRIDISPLTASDKSLGELIINGYFDVFHVFK